MTRTEGETERPATAGRLRGHRPGLPVAVAAAAFCVYLIWPALVPNGDGLGYIYMLRKVPPPWLGKHLLYLPTMSLLTDLGHRIFSLSTERVLVLVNQLSVAVATWAVASTVRTLGASARVQALTALGFALSHGVWIQATDIEVYATSLMFVALTVRAMPVYCTSQSCWNLSLLGLWTSLACLFHLGTSPLVLGTGVLVVIARTGSVRGRIGCLVLYGFVITALIGGPMVAVMVLTQGIRTPGEGFLWLTAAAREYSIPFTLLSIPRAIYGFCRTILFIEFFWTASRAVVALKLGTVCAATAIVVWSIWRTWPKLTWTASTVLTAWGVFALGIVVIGVGFFPSDTERWVFLMPACWAAAGLALEHWKPPAFAAAVVVVAVFSGLTFAQTIRPLALDSSIPDRVRALDQVLVDSALVISPSGDWGDYISYYSNRPVEQLGLLTLGQRFREDPTSYYAELDRHVERARAEHRQVVVLRVLDPTESARLSPWQELDLMGFSRDDVKQWLGRYRWREVRLQEPAGTLVSVLDDSAVPRRKP